MKEPNRKQVRESRVARIKQTLMEDITEEDYCLLLGLLEIIESLPFDSKLQGEKR